MEEIQQLLKYDLVNFREPFMMVWDDCHLDLAKACRVCTSIRVITSTIEKFLQILEENICPSLPFN